MWTVSVALAAAFLWSWAVDGVIADSQRLALS